MLVPKVLIKYLLQQGIHIRQVNPMCSDEIVDDEVKTISKNTSVFKIYTGYFTDTQSPSVYKFQGKTNKGDRFISTVFISPSINRPVTEITYEILIDRKTETVLAYVRV